MPFNMSLSNVRVCSVASDLASNTSQVNLLLNITLVYVVQIKCELKLFCMC